MTISPTPAPADKTPPPRSRYDWSSVQLGEWGVWVGQVVDGQIVPADIADDTEAMRQATRIRVAALDYARRHGLHVESHRENKGRVLLLRFTDPT